MTQVIDYRPHTWESWKIEYVPGIRVVWNKSKINPVRVFSLLVYNNSDADVFLVKYAAGDWMGGGKLEKWKPGKNELLVRCPAVMIHLQQNILILDGVHRILDLKPRALILDVIAITEKESCYFSDLKSLPK